MIYYKVVNNLVEKYNVTFDPNLLEDLKKQIIFKCSFIEHKEVVSERGCGARDIALVKNISRVKVGEHEYWEETCDIYKYTYDEYIPPKLVYLIDDILDGKSYSLFKIFNYSLEEDLLFDEKLKRETELFNQIDVSDTHKKREQLKKIDNILKSRELNQNQEDIKPYYDMLISYINVELIDTITLSEIERFESFFETKIFDEENVRIRK